MIDTDAARSGWSINPADLDDEEFSAGPQTAVLVAHDGSAANRADLLTVLMHEMARVLGLTHDSESNDLMAEWLATGVRRLPCAIDVDAVGQDWNMLASAL